MESQEVAPSSQVYLCSASIVLCDCKSTKVKTLFETSNRWLWRWARGLGTRTFDSRAKTPLARRWEKAMGENASKYETMCVVDHVIRERSFWEECYKSILKLSRAYDDGYRCAREVRGKHSTINLSFYTASVFAAHTINFVTINLILLRH